ncbi:MAG: PD-(D/E)XK nuclease family transposase [Lachnospiraceae bacterium]|nr:PD-(D/E)XK nuclease family transposase [Lachnospiraceae bacterium]
MSEKTSFLSVTDPTGSSFPVPVFPTKEKAEEYLRQNESVWRSYSLLPDFMKMELIGFCIGAQGLKITYDPVFRRIFNVSLYPERLENLLSAILGRRVKIISIMPREGTQMREQASFVVMDILVQLDDGSYANVEMQKIGYSFPLARADCYAADIIMRQYAHIKAREGKKFLFSNLHKVYCIVLMESSPREFHAVEGKYLHKRTSCFDTGVYKDMAGLHEDIFICLDSFHSTVHNITKDSSDLEAWLTFLSAIEPEKIHGLINAFPAFAAIYQEITDFIKKPEELMNMLSEALFIMDKNMERMMVTELQEEVEAVKAERKSLEAERDAAVTERDVAAAERDAAVTERDIVAAERDEAVAEKQILEVKLRKILDYAKAHGYEYASE